MATSARLEELKRKFDENPRRYFAPLANEFRKLGDVSQAIALCRAHLPNQPGHISGHIVLAQALYEGGELSESRQIFEAALELDPENLIALRYLGDIAREQGSVSNARLWYERVLEVDPRNEEIAELLNALEGMADQAFDPGIVERTTPVSSAVVEANSALAVERDLVNPAARSEPHSVTPDSSAPLDATFTSFVGEVPTRSAGTDATQDDAPMGGDDGSSLPAESPEAGADVAPVPAEPALDFAADVPDLAMQDGGELDDWFAQAETPVEDDPFATPSAQGVTDASYFPILSGMTPVHPVPAYDPPPPKAASVEADHEEPAAFAPPPPNDDLRVELEQSATVEPDFAATAEPEFAQDAAHDDAIVMTPLDESTDPEPMAAEDFELPPMAAVEESVEVSAGSGTAQDEPPAETEEVEVVANEAQQELDTWSDVEAAVDPSSVCEAEEADALIGRTVNLDAIPEVPSGFDESGDSERFTDWSPAPVEAASSNGEPSLADPLLGRTPDLEHSVPESMGEPFVTETMAELYLQQGFRDEALEIYRQLSARNPHDHTLRERVHALAEGARSSIQEQLEATEAEFSPPVEAEAPLQSAREFFGRFARLERRPGGRAEPDPPASALGGWLDAGRIGGAARTDEALTRPEPDESAAAGGSLADLFSSAPSDTSDERAALDLSSAYAASLDQPASPGANGELSLEQLFRDVPARAPDAVTPGGALYSGAASTTDDSSDVGEAANRGPADIEQFTAWLEELKKK
jgi:tetratricopeptide (TPR) repeat protein